MSNVCPTTGTYSVEHKMECLARDVINKPNLLDRQAFLADYGKKCGLKARLELETIIREQWIKLKEDKKC